jgi:hypothetical protein
MSNILTIAAVTAVIKDLIENGLVSDAIVSSIGDVTVTALPPDRIAVEADERPQLNLFLYQISPNRNADRLSNSADKQYARSSADRPAQPPLALDLYYLLTAYGAKDFQAELLLGYAINLLYKIPVLTSDRIEIALTNATKVSAANIFSQALSSISTTELAQSLGEIKISSEFLNLEETSRLWSLFQTHYRPSTAYRVSMVSMPERREYQPDNHTITRSIPQIDRVTTLGDRSITLSDALVIRGQNLQGETTLIRIGKKDIFLTTQEVQPTQINFKLPGYLAAGVQGIQVIHSSIATPNLPTESNLATFVLHPEITATVSSTATTGTDTRNADIIVKFNPKIQPSQQVVVRLKDRSHPQKIAYTCTANSVDTITELLTFSFPNIRPGNYLIQAGVDGAESLLTTAENRSTKIQIEIQ